MTDSHSPSTALLLIGHGTRNAAGQREFHETVELVRRHAAAMPVEGAFLELCEPSLDEGVRRLASKGARRIVAVPMLLFAAGHAQHDIPAQLADASRRFPQVELSQAAHLGCHELLLRLSAQRFNETLAAAGSPVTSERVALLMVGRGSSDAEATAEMRRFVELRVRQTPVAAAHTCFLAVAKPSLEEGIDRIAQADVEHVVVQPHLLFHGELLAALRVEVASAQRRHPGKQWRLAPHLGPHALLAQVILARGCETDAPNR